MMSDASETNTKYFGLCTKNGYVKENNEDSAQFLSGISSTGDKSIDFICACVADGVGGRPAGEIASEISVQTFMEKMLKFSIAADGDPMKALIRAVENANSAIVEANNSQNKGMATTFVGCFVLGHKLYYATSGDSSIFHIRAGKSIHLLNAMHRDLETGRLTSCLGFRRLFPICSGFLDLKGGDRICLATDGVTDLVPLKEIEKIIVDSKNDEKCADELVNRAMEHGGRDNATAIMFTLI